MLQKLIDLFVEPIKLVQEAPTKPVTTQEALDEQLTEEETQAFRETLDELFKRWYPEFDDETIAALVDSVATETLG